MASRRYAQSEVSERYARRDDRDWADELDYRSRPPPRDRERGTVVKEEVRVRDRSPPAFLREDYGRTSAGPVVLRGREREDFEYAPRRRSPSLETTRRSNREEIIMRREPENRREPPPPPPPPERDREEIIIRRNDRERERSRPPPPREPERGEYVIRRNDIDDRYDRRPPPSRDHYDREEVIIRHEHDDPRDAPRYRGYDDPYGAPRAISHERERSRGARTRAGSDTDEIIYRREEIDGGRYGRDRDREEIIIRKNDSRSPSPARAPPPPMEPPVINAPPIHQEVITHHRHVDHGYDVVAPPQPRARSRPPSPPTPPREDDTRIEIHHRGERNGRDFHEDIVIDRNQSRSAPPPRDREDDGYERPPYYNGSARRPGPPPPPAERWRDTRESREIQEEAEYYNQRALERSYPGEGYHGANTDWAIVDVPPGTRRVRMDGAGGGAQEITWQRYNGVRRSKFMPDGSDEGYGSEVGRPTPAGAVAPASANNAELGRRYAGMKDPKEGLWTEITKDLVIKEAIAEMGYEYEETDDFFYVIAYLKYVCCCFLLSFSSLCLFMMTVTVVLKMFTAGRHCPSGRAERRDPPGPSSSNERIRMGTQSITSARTDAPSLSHHRGAQSKQPRRSLGPRAGAIGRA